MFDGGLGLRIWLFRLATRFATVAPMHTTWLLGPQLEEQFLLCLLKHLKQDSLFLNVEMPECVAPDVADQLDYEWTDR